ncbi:MAG: DUF1800 domain-containing protein [Deltaproteobacteria bacterium]
MVTWDEKNAAHLLTRAGFGGKPREVTRYARRGQVWCIADLLARKPSKAKGPGRSERDRDQALKLATWWAKRMSTQTARRLDEKMALFWHDHFATQYSVVKNVKRMALQNRVFREFGRGSFHTLCHQVTRDPAMLVFLDNMDNRKGKINENFGRELMELFVLGVTDINGAPNYTQSDVEEISRALTGFRIAKDKGVMKAGRFDADPKTLFPGTSFAASGNLGVEQADGTLFPPATNVLDILLSHRDSDGELTAARFLGRKLWEYFAYPNPDKALVDELTTDFIAGGFVIGDLLRSIFLHDEFYSAAAKSSTVRNPVEFAIAAIRALEARGNMKELPLQLDNMGMRLFDPPSVNGWNQGLPWLSSGQFLARLEFAQKCASGRSSTLKMSPRKWIPKNASTADEVVDSLLARLQIQHAVPAAARQALVDYFAGATDFKDEEVLEKKVRGAVALALQLPEFQIH